MGNIVRVENVQLIDFEIKNKDRYIRLYSTPDMMEHLISKSYYGLKCEQHKEKVLVCRYASVSTDPFYDTDIFLLSSPKKIDEIVFDMKHRLQCAPDEFGMLCLSTLPKKL
uniref:Uncharacterized protein n=1 Tax=Mimivirus LCMiAC02 TaxID=2506609 RepID=A0A4D5XES1_9VIRU|nr:MAG: hypothetical protein LCMiAC02_03450 [Mimivirus LCMiAC02]